VERVTLLEQAMRSLSTREAKALLAWAVYGASIDAIAGGLAVTPEVAARVFHSARSKARHPAHAGPLYNELIEVDEGTLLIDAGLRSLIRELRVDETFAPTCFQCGLRYDVPPVSLWEGPLGRPRKYCSNACRQKAYRVRRREAR
jgi:hypothetical protein